MKSTDAQHEMAAKKDNSYSREDRTWKIYLMIVLSKPPGMDDGVYKKTGDEKERVT